MRPRLWKSAALVAVVLGAAVACAPAPKPNPPFLVTTTADTFDGICDEADCSLRDAIAESNVTPLISGQPNRVTLPEGTFQIAASEPINIARAINISGPNGVAQATFDITGSTIAAPSGLFDVNASFTLTSVEVLSTDSPAADVLTSCVGHAARTANLIDVQATGLAATSAACDTNLVGSTVDGPTTVIDPNRFSAASSTLAWGPAPVSTRSFALIGSSVTGPTVGGVLQESTLEIQSPEGLPNIAASITGSKLVGINVQIGGNAPGWINASVLSSSFDLNGPAGPVTIDVGALSKAKLVNSTVFGGGPDGALRVDGTLSTEWATITPDGPAIVSGVGGVVNLRRSVVGSTTGAASCSAPATSQGYNVVVGATCGTPAATDVSVATEADLQLGAPTTFGVIISQHREPAETSPVVDIIPPGSPSNLDCPTENGQARSIDARGQWRPSGAGCDAGAMEYKFPLPPEEEPAA
jgi:CSLREA domain-containing protein